jgi:hypothetical protein
MAVVYADKITKKKKKIHFICCSNVQKAYTNDSCVVDLQQRFRGICCLRLQNLFLFILSEQKVYISVLMCATYLFSLINLDFISAWKTA